MTRYGSEFPEPPWTYAPKEVEAWLSAVVPSARVSKLEAFKDGTAGTLENLEITLDVDAQKTRVRPSNTFTQWLQELTGRAKFESHFEVPVVAELVLKALAQAHYHGITKVVVDAETCYDNPDRPKDVRGTVELLSEASHRATRCDVVRAEVLDDELGETMAVVTVKRVVKKNEHAINVRFEGVVKEADFRSFLSFLSKNLNATFVTAP